MFDGLYGLRSAQIWCEFKQSYIIIPVSKYVHTSG